MAAIFDVLKLLFGWPFATFWETYTLDSHFSRTNQNEKEQEDSERIYAACMGGISSISGVCAILVWKALLLLGMTSCRLPWQFAVPLLVASIAMYAISFWIAATYDDEDDTPQEPRKSARLYDVGKPLDLLLVCVMLGTNFFAAACYKILWGQFVWSRSLIGHAGKQGSYGDFADKKTKRDPTSWD